MDTTLQPNNTGNPTQNGYIPSSPLPSGTNSGTASLNSGVPSPYQQSTPSTGFQINTNNINSGALASNLTPSSVMQYRNQLQSQYDQNNPFQQNYNAYIQSAIPNQNALAGYTAFSPEELAARQKVLDLNQGLREGVNNIRGRAEPVEFQQGQEAALTRDTALRQQAASDTLGNLESIRQNNIQVATAMLAQQQSNYTNQFNTIQAANTQGIQQGQLGVSQGQLGVQQQTANQGRYEYQQITDPNTGFPVIQVIDKTTGQPVTKVDPSSTQGQNIMATGLVNTNPQSSTPGTTSEGQAIVNSTSTAMGVAPADLNLPVAAAVAKYGIAPIVQGLIKQEGGSPQGVANNPGNIKFANLPGQINSGIKATDGGTFASYATPELGVQAVGQLVQNAAQRGDPLDKFIASYKGVKLGTPTAGGAGNSYQNVVSAAPPLIANAVKSLPDGTAFIDSGSLADSKYNVMATNFANQHGIKVLSPEDAKAAATIIQSIKNLNIQSNAFASLASDSTLGAVGSNVSDPLSKLFDTDYGSQLKAYQQNRDSLFQQIRSLAGSSPRLNEQELITAANSMPTLNEFSHDTLKDGVNKLVKTQAYLDNAIKSLVPSYVGTPVPINGQYAVAGKDGTTYMFPSSQAAMQFMHADK